MLSSQRQQEDASTSLLPQEGRTNIMDDESAILSASATPTGGYGENSNSTNFDGQAKNLSTTLQSNGDSPSQGGHERRDTGARYYCADCPPSNSGFTRQRDVRRHINYVHREGHIRHICHICGREYLRIDTLNRHLRNYN